MRVSSVAMMLRRSALSMRPQRAISGSVRPHPKQSLALGSMTQMATHGVSLFIHRYLSGSARLRKL
jgi:hypothetical protein